MDRPVLTGAQKARLRGLGQTVEASLKLGKGGLSPAFLRELRLQLDSRELVKLRVTGCSRGEKAALFEQVAAEAPCDWLGGVGHTALFFRPKPGGLGCAAGD